MNLSARAACELSTIGLRGRITGADTAELHERAARRYAELLGDSKGALMKAGQMLSFAPPGSGPAAELMPVYQEALALLRSDAPPMAPELARRVLEREVGPVERVYSEFDWSPLAAASIGQVHAARTHDGREVAVKIQYPHAAEAIGADLGNAELLTTLLSLVINCLPSRRLSVDVRGVAREFGIRIGQELDYWQEAINQDEFASHYRGHPFIRVPEVVWELCTDRVLTQERVHGLSWQQAVTASQEMRNRWAEAIWRFLYGSHCRFGLLHADPHPGNYLFHEDGAVSFLDFGCVKRLSREQATMIASLGVPCVQGDVEGLWRACLELGFWRACDPVTPEEVFDYWRGALEMYWQPQPVTVTPELAARWIGNRVNPSGAAAKALRLWRLPPDYAMMTRIEAATFSLIGQLRASNDWQAIGAEHFTEALPTTDLGKLDREFIQVGRTGGW